MERSLEGGKSRSLQAVILMAAATSLLLLISACARSPEDGLGSPISEDASIPTATPQVSGKTEPTFKPRSSSPEGKPAPFDAELRSYIPALIRPDADQRGLLQRELTWRRRFPAKPMPAPTPPPSGTRSKSQR